MRRLPVLVPASLILAAALLAGGCRRAREKAEERAIERQTGGAVQISGGNVTLRIDGGTVAVGANAKVPASFPAEVPVYPGARVGMAAESSQNGKTGWSLTLETGDARDKVSAFYRSSLAGFKQSSVLDLGDAEMSVWQGDRYDVTLMIATGADQKTTLTMTVASQ